jgi:hypothetical protein
MNHQLIRHSRFALACVFLYLQGREREAHRLLHPAERKQFWYTEFSSSVEACTRCKLASYKSTSVTHNAEERMKPGMIEAGDKPAKASRMA